MTFVDKQSFNVNLNRFVNNKVNILHIDNNLKTKVLQISWNVTIVSSNLQKLMLTRKNIKKFS